MQDLLDTHFQNPEKIGVGLAANQIGYDVALFLVYISKQRASNEQCDPMPITLWMNTQVEPLDKNEKKIPGKAPVPPSFPKLKVSKPKRIGGLSFEVRVRWML